MWAHSHRELSYLVARLWIGSTTTATTEMQEKPSRTSAEQKSTNWIIRHVRDNRAFGRIQSAVCKNAECIWVFGLLGFYTFRQFSLEHSPNVAMYTHSLQYYYTTCLDIRLSACALHIHIVLNRAVALCFMLCLALALALALTSATYYRLNFTSMCTRSEISYIAIAYRECECS